MSNVQFEEGYSQANSQYYSKTSKKSMSDLLINIGIARNKTAANIVLCGVIIVCIGAVFLIASEQNRINAVDYPAPPSTPDALPASSLQQE